MSEQNVVETSQEVGGEGLEGDFGNDFEGGADEDGGQGGQPAPGMGQSKSSRRRRRKRKKLTSGPAITAPVNLESSGEVETGAGNGASSIGYTPVVMQGESLALVASVGVPVQTNGAHRRAGTNGGQPGSNNGPAQGQNQAPGQGKRWKKKFRDRERRPGGPGGEPRTEGNAGGGERSLGAAAPPRGWPSGQLRQSRHHAASQGQERWRQGPQLCRPYGPQLPRGQSRVRGRTAVDDPNAWPPQSPAAPGRQPANRP